MTFWEILGLFVLCLTGWLLWSSLRAREAANEAIRAACKAETFLFLDDTVGLQSMWPARDANGRLTLRRVYGFEYSDTGNNRRQGAVTMIGATPSAVRVDTTSGPEG